jgi:hypothetical protein
MESGASEGPKDVKKHSPKAIILLGGGLLLSAIAVLLGAGSLILALSILADGFYDNYVVWGFLMAAGLAVVLLVPGIIGLRACIRRFRAMRSSSAGRQMAYLLVAPVALCVLAGIALAVKPISGDHLQMQRLAGRKSFAEIKLAKADLSYADLSYANLTGADLGGADLSYADLSYANLTGADLGGANLSEADLTGADLSGANLSSAYLWTADLRRADLRGADLRGANLSRAKVTAQQLAEAKSLKGATMSDGTVHE